MNTIQHWTDEAHRIRQEAESTFGHLQVDQLNWRPDPAKWSVGQCLEHLIVSNTTYFPILKSIVTGEKEMTFWEKMPILPGFFGKGLIKSLQPNAERKLQAPQAFQPVLSNIPVDIIAQFGHHQQELIEWIQKTENTNHRQLIITSPASKFVTYSLADAFTIILVHERRHLEQAKRVMHHELFP